MDAATLTAVIAATVSMASVVANLYIARGARQSAIDTVRLKARLDHDEVADKVIKEIEIEGERLRIEAWKLIDFCHSNEGQGSEAQFSILIESFVTQAEEFLDRWAPTKSELPIVTLEVLRVLRHDCRREISQLHALSPHLFPEVESSDDRRQAFMGRLIEITRKVDNFTSKISKIRRASLTSAFSSDDSLWKLEK
jgi:hypothetical protein